MKNQISLKSILPQSLCIVGTLFFLTACTEKNTIDTKEVAKQENNAKLDAKKQEILVVDKDAKFLVNAAEIQLEEISLGKLAQQKGTSLHVKELGRMMEDDHSKTLSEIQKLAQSKYVSIPSSITEDSKDAYDKLNDKTGKDFDKAYSTMMVKLHKSTIDLFEKASTDSEDLEIRTWASEKIPAIKSHLRHAEECKKKCDKL